MAVREGLLALLDDGRRHGYQLKTEFEQATGGVWPLNVGQVYTTLERLERDGLVAVAEDERPEVVRAHRGRARGTGGVVGGGAGRRPAAARRADAQGADGDRARPRARPRRDHPPPHRPRSPCSNCAAARAATTPLAGTTWPPPSSPTPWWYAPKPTCAGSTSANPASADPKGTHHDVRQSSNSSTSSNRSAGARPRSTPCVASTWRVAPGELLAVMGPSGCGKSTLLHLAGGLETPSAGRVKVDGRDLGDLSAEELATLRRRDVGYVFQRLNLVPSLTAVENVMLPLELDGRGGRPGTPGRDRRAPHARPDSSPRPLSRRLLRWAAAAHRHRPRGRRRAPAAARRRADRFARHARTATRSSRCWLPCRASSELPSCSSPTSHDSPRTPIVSSSCATGRSSTRRRGPVPDSAGELAGVG